MNIDNMPTETELREALFAAANNNCVADFVLDIDDALASITLGDVQPWAEYEGSNLAESLAMACAMNEGSWWVRSDRAETVCALIAGRLENRRFGSPTDQQAWDKLIEDEAYTIEFGPTAQLMDIAIGGACKRIQAAWAAR